MMWFVGRGGGGASDLQSGVERPDSAGLLGGEVAAWAGDGPREADDLGSPSGSAPGGRGLAGAEVPADFGPEGPHIDGNRAEERRVGQACRAGVVGVGGVR